MDHWKASRRRVGIKGVTAKCRPTFSTCLLAVQCPLNDECGVVDEAPLKPRPNFMKQNAPGGLPRAAENSHSALRRIIFSYLHDCNALSLKWSCGFELQSGPSWHRRHNFCVMKILSLTVKTKQIVHDIAWKRQKLSGPCDFPN